MPILFLKKLYLCIGNSSKQQLILYTMRNRDFYNSYQSSLSVELNRNYRVKVGRNLVGYSGLTSLLGFMYANHLIEKCRNLKTDKKRFYDSRLCLEVIFYLK